MTDCGSRFNLRAMRPNFLLSTHSGMSSAPRTDGPSPDKCEPRAHIFENLLILGKKDVFSFLQSFKPKLDDLFQNCLTLPTWMPTKVLDQRTKDFLKNLEVPCVRKRPSVLLHRLGDFVEEPELQRRVDDLFSPDAPQNAIFINTSGSGKTRLLLEGLCQHWGLYFTSYVDSSFLGSFDLQKAIDSTIRNDRLFRRILPPVTSPKYLSRLQYNERLAERVFKRVFLARVLIFHLFVEAMKGNISSDSSLTERDFKRRWLLLQLQPSVFTKISDPFRDLSRKLKVYDDAELDHLTEEVLRHIQDTLSSCSSPGCIPLYCIIDEAQFAAKEDTDAFRSKSMERRPILRPLIQTFTTLTDGFDVFIILAGTGLSKSDVENTMASGTMKLSSYRLCYDTGAFEGWEGENGMSTWVKMFVPDWILEEPEMKRLEERMGFWLKGRFASAFYIYDNIFDDYFASPLRLSSGSYRYRFVAGYVTELLRHGYRQPSQLLDIYISRAIGCKPAINRESVGKEKQAKSDDIELEPRGTFNFDKLGESGTRLTRVCVLNANMLSDNDTFAKFRDILPLYVMRSMLRSPLGDDDQLWIEHGVGRLRKEQGAFRVVFDEPLAVAAANRWFNAKSDRSYAYFAQTIGMHDSRGSFNGFENYTVYCLHLIFGAEKERKLRDVFKFHGREEPQWAGKRAKLVSVYVPSTGSHSADEPNIEDVKHGQFTGPSATLGTHTDTAGETLEWLAHGFRTPFCFPCPNMGPDVIFVLELDDKKRIWVALQVKYSESNGTKLLDKSKLDHAVKTVTPEHFFRDKVCGETYIVKSN